MKKTKKILGFILIISMLLTLAACGGGTDAGTGTTVPPPADGATNAPTDNGEPAAADQTRTIRVGLWWDEYYDSTHSDIYADPRVNDEFRAQMEIDNLREVEQRYNVRFEMVNLTWEGTIESINTSIMAGAPDCDIYYTDLQFGIPAVLNGYAQSLESFLPADSDVLNDQIIMKHLNILDAPENFLFAEAAKNAEGYPLGFNLTMVNEANLEDPRDLYDRGEWTWDVWREYLLALTKDTNGDGVTDIYGYGGYWTNMFENLLPANNAHVAGDTTEGLSSPQTREVMEFFQTIYQVDKTARPWNEDDWESNLRPFTDGIMAFFVTKDWIIQNFADSGNDLNYELGVVPWPYGPSGDKEGSMKYRTGGNWLMIPVGTQNPSLVYSAFYDYVNWYKDDTDLRDEGGSFDWQAEMYLNERNFEMAIANGSIPTFDIWDGLGLSADMGISMVTIMNGEQTPAQYAEENRQVVQDRLNAFFGN